MTDEMEKPGTKLKPRAPRWLWLDRLAIGKLCSVVGQEDQRKSLLCATIAAIITDGGEWPGDDGGRPNAGNVIYVQREDDFHDTTLPRLIVAGAQVMTDPITTEGPPYYVIVPQINEVTLGGALDQLERDYLQPTADLRLLIIDPFNSFIEGQNSHRMARSLQRLRDIAKRYRIAVVLVHHFNKQLKKTVREMVFGSSMVRTYSRIMLAVQRDPEHTDRSILTGDKNNAGHNRAEGLVFGVMLRQLEVEGGEKGSFPVVAWQGTDDRTADEIAAELCDNVKEAGKESKQRRRQKISDWTEFLTKHISPGDRMREKEIEEKAREANLLRPNSLLKDCRPADHAVKELSIEKIPGRPDGGGHAVSWWLRPRDDDERDGDERERDDGGNDRDHAHPALNDEVTK